MSPPAGKEWSPWRFFVVSGTVGEKLEESDLAMVPAGTMDDAMEKARKAAEFGADVTWIFERTGEFAELDPETARYVPIPGWKLVRTV